VEGGMRSELNIFKALSDETRVRILKLLEGEHYASSRLRRNCSLKKENQC